MYKGFDLRMYRRLAFPNLISWSDKNEQISYGKVGLAEAVRGSRRQFFPVHGQSGSDPANRLQSLVFGVCPA